MSPEDRVCSSFCLFLYVSRRRVKCSTVAGGGSLLYFLLIANIDASDCFLALTFVPMTIVSVLASVTIGTHHDGM